MKRFAGFLMAALLVMVPMVQSALANEGLRDMGGMKAQREDGDSERHRYGLYLHHLIRHSKEIGLTKDQVAQLKKIRLDFERVCLRAKAEIGVSDLELAALADDEKADMKTIEAKVKQRATAAAGLQVAAIKARREARALLTAEQRDKEQAIHEKMMEQMREQQRGMGGMGGGMMQGGGQMGGGMPNDGMQDDQGDSSQQEEPQGEHQSH
ncbi:MAG: hypothetical protein C3F08_10600 [Candidatus Methylomirabilota bacterium]|nr:MAG: hypothetical protein C3F08_10600 [candidate division NC10 bacterium]